MDCLAKKEGFLEGRIVGENDGETKGKFKVPGGWAPL